MTVDLNIDTATYAQLVDAAIKRIPTASRGNWTLHAPVDPGITLVELFAWLLEQRSYWADQVTAPLVDRVMALVGDGIAGAKPAGVAVTFEPELSDGAVAITRDTVIRVPDTELAFAIAGELTALPLVRYPASAGRVGPPKIGLADVAGYGADDLRTGHPVPLLPVTGAGRATFELALAAPAPATATLPIAILVELDVNVLPQWHPDAAPAQPPAIVRWQVQDATGAWQDAAELDDGTLGLRRSGIVRFAMPASWAGKTSVSIRVATDNATFSSPPVLSRIMPNSAIASHRTWQRHEESPNWLPLPGRTIALDAGLPLPETVSVVITELSATRTSAQWPWRVVPDFVTSGPADRVVVVDRRRAQIVLGDGLTGRVARLDPAAKPQVVVTYAIGGGIAGNVPPIDAWETVTGSLPTARSYVAAVGGEDAETIDEARTRVTAELREPTRAVTADDHANIAMETPGVDVARAHAEVGLSLGDCGVVPGVTTVFIVPGVLSRTRDDVRAGTAVNAPVADPGMLAEVRARFATTRLVGETVVVVAAAYRMVAVRVTVSGAPSDRDGVRRRISAAIRNYLDPLLGGDDGDGWPFGEPVRPTALLGVAQREIGDRGDVDQIDIAIDGGAFESCNDVAIRPYELVAVTRVDIAIETAVGTEVGLR